MSSIAGTIASAPDAAPARKSHRIAAIDWMRGFVMILMVVDHASMAFDAQHMSEDSAMYAGAGTMALPAGAFFTRWMTHLCAPTFVFLAGTALALSVERRMAKGMPAAQIDRDILVRGAFIAMLDPTLISLGSGRMTFQVLFAIGLAMMSMTIVRRLPSWLLITLALGWIGLGEFLTAWWWQPPGSSSIVAAFLAANYGSSEMIIKYPLLPWVSVMMLGWVLGRHMVRYAASDSGVAPKTILGIAGMVSLAVFFLVRGAQGYGDMFLHRADNSWEQWLHVSKYPPSLTYFTLELGLFSLILAAMMAVEPLIGVRQNGVLLVFGQTSMFFYLAHRLAFEIPATYFGWRGAGNIGETYLISALALIALYPACRWFRTVKSAHPDSWLRFI